jgi:hypothetical protein
MLTRILYISAVAEGVTDLDVQIILGASQVNNRRLDITGMLAQSDGHFVQWLEGRTEVIREMMTKIAADRRHREVRLLHEEPIERRRFSRWAMELVRRDDLTDAMNRLHRDGGDNTTEMHDMIRQLLEGAG